MSEWVHNESLINMKKELGGCDDIKEKSIDPDIQKAGKDLMKRVMNTIFLVDQEKGFFYFDVFVKFFQFSKQEANEMMKPFILELLEATDANDMRDDKKRLHLLGFLANAKKYF